MYFKMAYNNIRKSFKDYSVYFITLTFAVCIFYSFNSITSQSIFGEMNESQAQYVDILNQMMSILSVGVSIILGCLIIYSTNFLIRRRKKEFGIYMILGMRKRSMSTILFLETLYIGIISMAAGIILGLILSQILSILTAKLFVIEMTKYSFSISISAVSKTVVYFTIMYTIVMIFNIICVSRYKLIDLLNAGKKNEKIKVRNIYISSIILILSITILGFAYHYIEIAGIDYTKIEFKYSIAMGVIGTLLFFYGISSVLFYIVSKKTYIYYNNLNCFSIRQISSKFNTNFLSMTVICLMLLVTIGSLSCGLAVKESMELSLKKTTVFDASIVFQAYSKDSESYDPIDEIESLGYKFDEKSEDIILKTYINKGLDSKDILSKYVDSSDNMINELMNSNIFNGSTNMITISDFNKIREIQGNDTINLADDEILVLNNYEPVKELVDKFIKNQENISINEKNYKIKNKKVFDDCLYTSPVATSMFILIVPDKAVENDDVYVLEQIVNINFNGSKEDKKEQEGILTKILNKEMFRDYDEQKKINDERGFYLCGMTRQMCIDSSRGVSTLALFVAIYIGIVFLISSAAVLAIQQLSSCNESIERYGALRKIGAVKTMINKSIFIQVCIFFMLPLSLAIVHSIVGVRVVNSYLMALGSSNQINSILLTALIIIIVYGGYLYGTYISYKNIIDNEFS